MNARLAALRHAFTLVELLVVIAIIAVLAAALLPAVTGAQARGLEADCTSNLKQLGAGMYQYATSRGGTFPAVSGLTESYFGAHPGVISELADYTTTNAGIWYCKRYLKGVGVNRDTEFAAGRIGYYYWAWTQSGTGISALDMGATTSYWRSASWTTNVPGTVLMSDVFWDTGNAPISSKAVQFHSGSKYEVPLTEAGSLVLIGGGSIHKVGPRK